MKEKIIDKIRKLLELSKSKNEHEAANAAARAAELMLDHQIEEAELAGATAGQEEITEEAIGGDKMRVQWRLLIAHGLAKSLGADCYSHTYPDRCEYRVFGTKAAIQTVSYMYQYLVPEVDRLADLAYGQEATECRRSGVEPPSARAWKGSFRVGCARMIGARLLEQRKETIGHAADDGKTTALTVLKKEQLAVEAYRENLTKRVKLKPTKTTAGSRSQGGLAAGLAAGKTVNLGGNPELGRGAAGRLRG